MQEVAALNFLHSLFRIEARFLHPDFIDNLRISSGHPRMNYALGRFWKRTDYLATAIVSNRIGQPAPVPDS
jgi:hypothetical protein